MAQLRQKARQKARSRVGRLLWSLNLRGPRPAAPGAGPPPEITPGSALLSRYASVLPAGPGRVVALVSDGTVGEELASYLAAFSQDRVTVLGPVSAPEWRTVRYRVGFRLARNLNELHRELAQLGPIDVMVNLQTGTDAAHLTTFNRIFYHVREDGAYVVPRRSITTGGGSGLLRRLSSVAQYVGSRPDELSEAPAGLREHARSSGRIVVAADFVIVGKSNQHLLKLRDDSESIRLMRRRGLRVTALAHLKQGTLRGAGKVTSHEAAVPIDGLEPNLPYPALYLRRYEGRIALAPGALAYHDHSILPDSFRWHLEANPVNPRLDNVDAWFARFRDQHHPDVDLPGAYYYFDYSNSGHFGHLLTEALPKLWGWDIAKRDNPDLKMLVRSSYRGAVQPEPTLDTIFLEAYGVSPEDIVWVDEPVWVESLVGASTMWHSRMPHYVHPRIQDVWTRLRSAIRSPDAPVYPRIFVTRRVGNRRCRNIDEVENLFASHGFEIVYPERLPISEQAGVFANAETIAGFGGSNLFNLMWAEKASTLIMLNHEAYNFRNEHLYATVLGADSHYFWSTPDLPQPEGGWSYDAFQSDWDFDFARNGAELERLLKNLH